MTFSNQELKKIFYFILTNKRIAISDYGLFSRDTLIMLNDIINKKRPNDFVLSRKRQDALIDVFLTGNDVFDDYTPFFILTNPSCIDAAIERDLCSVNFVTKFTPKVTEKVLDLALRKKYVLCATSPNFLKNSYAIALNSIRKNASSADFVGWAYMTKEDQDDLIDEAINAGYVLTSNSSQFLKKNPRVVIASIARDVNTMCYVDPGVIDNPDVFRCLIANNYNFSANKLKRRLLVNYADSDIMKFALSHLKTLDKSSSEFMDDFKEYQNDVDKYIDRFSSLFANAIKTRPLISNFNGIFQYDAEKSWEKYRGRNLDELVNIFGKICVELQTVADYNEAIYNLDFLPCMEKALGDKYSILCQAMVQYHSIMHSGLQLGDIDYARDQIASLSALYVAIRKENYKKEHLEGSEKTIKRFFILKKDHPKVRKKIIENKRKAALKTLYDDKNDDIMSFLKGIVKQYVGDVSEEILWRMIDKFISDNRVKMDEFIKAPRGYNSYKRYEEASKLVNRLNSKYIEYTDQELYRFLDIIQYDENNGKYYYSGPYFNEELIAVFKEYQRKQGIFEKIKQQIIFKSRTICIDEDIDIDELEELADEFPFTDEYFEYYESYIFDFEDFLNYCIYEADIINPVSILDDDTYNALNNYLINNGLIWLLLFLNFDDNENLIDCFDKFYLLKRMDSMYEILNLCKKFNYDITKYADVSLLESLMDCADEEAFAILGKDLIEKLANNTQYTDGRVEEIVGIAQELVCEMVKRESSTVPYIKGSTGNYRYSLYDSQDETLLLAGINTSACFRVDGNDNDFLHYCALDKNGFVIKITDIFDNFIARASGFRNGNTVYINQLRTIYDNSSGCLQHEKEEIIKTFKKACVDIVETSQKTPYEKDKIDYVFVTKSYSLGNYPSNVSGAVVNRIGRRPMISNTSDWKNFVRNTRNLRYCSVRDGFTVDYGNYNLICMASSKQNHLISIIRPRDIKDKDVDAVYTRERNDIVITDKLDAYIINRVNRINGIYSYTNGTEFEPLSIVDGLIIFLGDNWYIAYSNGAISSSRVLDFDNHAKIEYEATKVTLEDWALTSNQQLDITQVSQEFEERIPNGYAKVLRLNN